MSKINRSLVVVKPKQPFLDWARAFDLDEGLQLDQFRDESSAYLTPEFEFQEHRMEVIAWCLDCVFEEELSAGSTDETIWPKRRDLTTFLEWFDVEFHGIVFDLTPQLPLEHIDYDDVEDDGDDDEDDEPGSNGHPSSNGHERAKQPIVRTSRM